MEKDAGTISSVLKEARVFPPQPGFAARARVKSLDEYRALYRASIDDPDQFWAGVAREFAWTKPWSRVLAWAPPHARWFVGGETNISANCLDRHLGTEREEKVAIVWEGEPGEVRRMTYGELHREVCRCANALKRLGVAKGDRVIIYMPMVPELAVTMLACARIGATHSVVFGGFSATAVRDRVNDSTAKVIVTADGGWRRGQVVPLKAAVDEALAAAGCPSVEKVVVLRRTGSEVGWVAARDVWWHEVVASADEHCDAEPLDSEHPLFILYTSGTTGKPKGVVHTTGGYMVGTAYTARLVFDLRDDDVYWCTADLGWVTGHSYVVYGPLANGATTVMYEGAPNFPEPDRFWKIIKNHRVSIFYTAPTAIRAFMKWGDEWPRRHDLSTLRLLGTVGEPINPEAWIWYRREIGGDRCPIVDTWWQTETGAMMIAPLPGATPTKPGSATMPLPGVVAEVVDREGRGVPDGVGGYLVLRRPWPSMLRTIHGDDSRYRQQYWSQIAGGATYFTGDGARRDADGYFWIMGRIDDVINVAGHRLGTMEIESALVSHAAVAEAAVVGRPDELKGQAIVAFVSLVGGQKSSPALGDELRAHVVREIGVVARPDEIRFTDALPKTRSGKIMRRLLGDIAANRATTGDTTTLEDLAVLAKLRMDDEE